MLLESVLVQFFFSSSLCNVYACDVSRVLSSNGNDIETKVERSFDLGLRFRYRSETNLLIRELVKIEAERTLLILHLRKIEAKQILFIPKIRKI